MQQRDAEAFQRLMSDAMAFYRQDVSEFALGVWWQACRAFDLEQVRKALTAHAMDPERGAFPPKPADIVRQLQGTHTDRALMAWGKVFDAMQSVGAYSSIDFGDAATHAAITDMGGWPALCRIDLDTLPFVQKRFCDFYRVYSARGASDAPLQLAGEHALTNAALGYSTREAPVQIGSAPSRPLLPPAEAA